MSSTPYHTQDWWVSPFNYIPEVRSQLTHLPSRVRFHDVTCRDGEQTPGVVFRKHEKVRIAQLLDELGVDRIEVALPAVSAEDVEAVKAVVKMRPRAQVFVLCRATEKDIDLAVECGVDGVVLEMPVGTPRLQYQFKNWTEDSLMERTRSALDYAQQQGLNVVIFPMDITRAEPPLFDRFLETIAGAPKKPDGLALVDTTGCLLPQAASYMVSRMRDAVGCPIEIHTHNDFELGIATPLAALAAGAEVVHGSIAGLGERTGNTSIESVATAIRALYGLEMGIAFDKLTPVAREVMAIAGKEIPIGKPVIGERAFTRESGMGLDLVYEQPLALWATNPAWFGREPAYVLGKKSGLPSVRMKLAELGISGVSEEHQTAILSRVKDLGIETKALVDDDAFRSIVTEVTGG